MKNSLSDVLLTPPFRAAFVNVFEPSSYEGDPPTFNLVALFPTDIREVKRLMGKPEATMDETFEFMKERDLEPSDYTDFTKLIAAKNQVIKAQWGKQPSNFKSPFRSCNEKDYGGYEDGWIFCRLSRSLVKHKMPPPVIAQDGKRRITDSSEFYSGCWARAYTMARTYDVKGNRGVAFVLRSIQKLRDDEPLGGSVETEFEAVAQDVAEPEELQYNTEYNDDIPF